VKVATRNQPTADARPVQAYARAAGGGKTRAAQPVADNTEILGIPAAELTPKVREAILRLMAEVDSLKQELDQSRERIAYLEQLSDRDALAPLANRRAFVREMSRVMAFSERYSAPASLIFFDVNGLKPINDTHGHLAGDAALMHIADILVENVRESDIVGRLGGDEFGVILSQADEDAAREKAESLGKQIESAPLIWNDIEIEVGIAFGTYTFQGGDTANDALAAADKAMYAHKRATRPGATARN